MDEAAEPGSLSAAASGTSSPCLTTNLDRGGISIERGGALIARPASCRVAIRGGWVANGGMDAFECDGWFAVVVPDAAFMRDI